MERVHTRPERGDTDHDPHVLDEGRARWDEAVRVDRTPDVPLRRLVQPRGDVIYIDWELPTRQETKDARFDATAKS
jgi:hypothetical protein